MTEAEALSTKPDGAIDMKQVESLIEVRDIYDGWSVAIMKDGRWLNRWKQPQWEQSSPTIRGRARRTDEWIHSARIRQEQDDWTGGPSAATPHHGKR